LDPYFLAAYFRLLIFDDRPGISRVHEKQWLNGSFLMVVLWQQEAYCKRFATPRRGSLRFGGFAPSLGQLGPCPACRLLMQQSYAELHAWWPIEGLSCSPGFCCCCCVCLVACWLLLCLFGWLEKPGRSQEDPREAQGRPQTASKQSHDSPKAPKTAQEKPKTAQDSPRQTQDRPKTAQDSPDRPKTSPRKPQDNPKAGSRHPKTAQDSPRTTPRRPRDGPKTAQDKPKKAQRGAKMGLTGSSRASRYQKKY
jgi:hypothetical protein